MSGMTATSAAPVTTMWSIQAAFLVHPKSATRAFARSAGQSRSVLGYLLLPVSDRKHTDRSVLKIAKPKNAPRERTRKHAPPTRPVHRSLEAPETVVSCRAFAAERGVSSDTRGDGIGTDTFSRRTFERSQETRLVVDANLVRPARAAALFALDRLKRRHLRLELVVVVLLLDDARGAPSPSSSSSNSESSSENSSSSGSARRLLTAIASVAREK